MNVTLIVYCCIAMLLQTWWLKRTHLLSHSWLGHESWNSLPGSLLSGFTRLRAKCWLGLQSQLKLHGAGTDFQGCRVAGASSLLRTIKLKASMCCWQSLEDVSHHVDFFNMTACFSKPSREKFSQRNGLKSYESLSQ